MSIKRPFWQKRIEQSWKKAPIVWLAGVRRSGKTTFAHSIENSTYLNCDLPSVQETLKNPELFFKQHRSKIFIFDEIHQLEEASLLLKIGADLHQDIKILATGSSTLVAGKKFKDTLSGRKRHLHFLPILLEELGNFNASLEERVLKGGLPPVLLAEKHDLEFYAEWLDSFYARDIQEIFNVDKRQPFLKALEYLLVSNSNLLEVTKLAQVAGISRPTAVKYLDVLELTQAITVLRPFHKNSEQELVSQPKVYGFDTGFCCYVQGVRNLGPNDVGPLLENLTLESFQAYGLGRDLRFWRTKTKKEIDFVLPIDNKNILAVECKWREKNFSKEHLVAFRDLYTKGENWVVTSDSITRTVSMAGVVIRFINICDLAAEIRRIS